MTLATRLLSRPAERRDSGDPWMIPPPGGVLGQMSKAGTIVNDKGALSIMTFFAGVRIIAEAVSATPVRAVTQNSDGIRTPLVNKPVQIVDPFQDFRLSEGISQIVVSLILRGNAYTYTLTSDAAGRPTCVRILHPDQVRLEWGKDGYRRYFVNGNEVDTDLITHLAMFMVPGALKGCGIVEYCRNSLGLGIALDEVAGTFFKNGIMSTGIVSVEEPLTPDEVRSTAEQFRALHAGVDRANMPIVMSGGAQFHPISLTPNDAQFLQSRQFQNDEIATLLGIPPHLLGMVDRTTSWGTGIEVQGRAFVDYTLRCYYHRLETMFSGWMQNGTYAECVTDALTRADTTSRFAQYHMAITDGWLNKDEIRLREGLPPLPDGAGQVYYTPVTQAPTSNQDGIFQAVLQGALPTDNPSTGDPNGGDQN